MDNRQPLPPGYLLTLNNQKFRLLDRPLRGGSSLVYSARLEDGNTRDFFMIKEFYPIELCEVIKRMPDGDLHFIADPGTLNERKKRVLNESKIIDELRHGDNSTSNNPWFLSYSKPMEANNTLYTVITTESGMALSDRIISGYFKNKKFEDVCSCILLILDALEPLHNKNYLHLDISPDNIHFSDLKIARLIDFNSAHRADDSSKRPKLSFKEGYSAIELMRQVSYPPGVSFATDLFSVAAIFFEILIGRPQGSDDRIRGIQHVNSATGYLAGASELLVNKTNDFLTKGIAHTQRLRFQSFGEMRKSIQELIKLKTESNLINAPNRVRLNKNFVHRMRDIEFIGEALERDNYVILQGIRGTGKTELAKSYACETKYDIVQFVNFDRNLQKTIAYNLQFHSFDTYAYEARFGQDPRNIFFWTK